MDILIKVLQFVLSFSILVIVHEFGHFIFARIFKTRVEKFYLFFDPWFSLFKYKKGDTEYGIGWIPFGGYVKISGMIDESMDTEQLKQPAQPYEFRSKPAWQRLLIMVGGVTMNVILALIIYIGISYHWGDNYIATEDAKYGFVYNDLAQEIGFKNGDQIVDIGGEKVEDSYQVLAPIIINQAKYATVLRDGEQIRIDIPEEAMPRLLNDEGHGFAVVRSPFVIEEVADGLAAQQAGFQKGDSLIGINGNAMTFVDQFQEVFRANAGKSVVIDVVRDSAGTKQIVTLPVEVAEGGTVIGVYVAHITNFLPLRTHTYTFLEAIPNGIKRTGTELNNYVKQVKLIFSPKTEAYKSLGGLITIGNIFPEYWSWLAFWKITALLSVILAVMNILPIPALDGGHVLFLLYEVITRRKPSDKFMEHAQMVGIIILFALLIYANGNDIYKFFIK